MVTLRGFEPGDLDGVYAIALATGDAGKDASPLHKDPRLIGNIYAAPYALLRPELMLVAADDVGVVGYVTGAVDTAAWEARLERDWWPKLRLEHADPDWESRGEWTADQVRTFMIHHPRPTPAALVEAYPAHLHMNLLERAQRRGIGSALLEAWFNLPACRDVTAAHVGVSRANAGGLGFWGARGFEVLTLPGLSSERTVWMGRLLPGAG
jgi:GNAT superfamily N-acetyltransferase